MWLRLNGASLMGWYMYLTTVSKASKVVVFNFNYFRCLLHRTIEHPLEDWTYTSKEEFVPSDLLSLDGEEDIRRKI